MARPSKRGAIVDAAVKVIAARGVRNLRVEDVSREAGISNALLYYYFDDRAALVRAALERSSAQAPSTRSAEPPPSQPARAWLADALLAELDDAPRVRDSSIVWNEVSASAIFDPALREALQRVTDDWSAVLRRGVAAGLADGSIAAHVDPADAAEQLAIVVEGLSLRWLAGTLTLERAHALLVQALDAHLPVA